MLIVGIIVLAYIAIGGMITLAIWGAGWYRRRGVEMREGEWLPWHPWFRRHPAVEGWVIGVLNVAGWLVSVHVFGKPGNLKATGYLFILAVSAILGLLAWFVGRRNLRRQGEVTERPRSKATVGERWRQEPDGEWHRVGNAEGPRTS